MEGELNPPISKDVFFKISNMPLIQILNLYNHFIISLYRVLLRDKNGFWSIICQVLRKSYGSQLIIYEVLGETFPIIFLHHFLLQTQHHFFIIGPPLTHSEKRKSKASLNTMNKYLNIYQTNSVVNSWGGRRVGGRVFSLGILYKSTGGFLTNPRNT